MDRPDVPTPSSLPELLALEFTSATLSKCVLIIFGLVGDVVDVDDLIWSTCPYVHPHAKRSISHIFIPPARPEEVLKAVKHMLAMEVAYEPRLRGILRKVRYLTVPYKNIYTHSHTHPHIRAAPSPPSFPLSTPPLLPPQTNNARRTAAGRRCRRAPR